MKKIVILLLFTGVCSISYSQERKTYYSLRNALQNPSKVYILDLSKKNLKYLPPAIGKFTHLTKLDLSYNQLKTLPPEIGKLTHLRMLDLSFNQLKVLPPEIGKLTHLTVLNLSFNQLIALPPEIGHLNKLKALSLSFNRISELPPNVGKLVELKMLTVKQNPLTTLPDEINNLNNLSSSCKKSIVRCVIGNNPKYQFKYEEEHIDAAYMTHPDKPQVRDEPKERPELDFSFFTTEELKQMYRDAFNRKDYENVALLQEELAKRVTNETAADTTAQYRGGGDPMKGLNISRSDRDFQAGDYYALIIGIDNYQGYWAPLKNAVNDAKAIEKILITNYKFDHVKTLYNEDATGENIIKELEWLVANVKENDNVFIYYSGHGDFKQQLNKGYWVPVDAQTTSTYRYISNSDIQTFMGGIKSKHTLLASDACFSGDIFRGNTVTVPFEETDKYYKKVYDLVSRQAITSGGIEPVMDGGREGHSIFAYYLLKMFEKNQRKYYDAGQLFNDIKIPVTNNSDQFPHFQAIKSTGDEGGQFIFIKR